MPQAVSATHRFWFCPIALLIAAIAVTRPCTAESDSLRRAAETYDAAVAHFERAEYAAAAKLFLEADTIHPSPEALSNAIAAARQANDHLLVARIAQRAEGRADTAPDLATRARKALAEAEVHLSRLDLDCAPAPCEIDVDGSPVQPGRLHVLPGSHRVTARVNEHTRAHDLVTNAGATYRISLEVSVPEPRASNPSPQYPQSPATEAEVSAHEARPLPPAAFYASLAVTGVVTGLTIWSGLEALEQKRELDDSPSQESVDRLRASVRRTDILLASSALLAATTAYIGWKLVDFGDADVRAQVSPNGCNLSASGRFW